MLILISVNGLALKDKLYFNNAAVTEKKNENEREPINSNLNKHLLNQLR